MKCPKCHESNDTNARFCADCGTSLQQPRPSRRPQTPGQTPCPRCGTENPTDSSFCENCGNRLSARTAPRPAPTVPPQPVAGAQVEKRPTSAAWWLLPIFLGIIGGLIGFVVVRDSDKKKSNRLLILGIVMNFVVWPILWGGLAALVNYGGILDF